MSVRNVLLLALSGGVSLLVPGAAWGHATGADPGYAGVPNENGNCTACHGNGTNSVNTGGGSLQISLPGGVTTYLPGQPIRLTITLQDPTARRWGFELASRSATSPSTQAGTLTPVDTNSRRNDFGLQYVTHTLQGSRAGTANGVSWDVDWMPPAAGGVVRLYVAGNAANNNSNNDSGDKIYTNTLDLTPADSSLPSNFRVLPQFVFGGGSTGFYSALYLYNGGDVGANFPVHFFDAAGQPMSVPVSPGVSSPNHTVVIPARGLAVIEAPNTAGSTSTEGWAAVELPANVTASGVFRLTAGSAPDQEAVVPLASNSSKDVILVFDDRENMRTGVAIANPTSESIQVNIVARDDSGTTIGITAKNIPPRGKQASFFLEDDANLGGMKGKKGTVEFTVGTGAVSVLGLRVRGLAFTSIPAIER